MNKKQTPTSLDFEITNVEQMNDNISECDVRVFYHGKNRNGSYISKAVGEQIATTLPRAPIVAFYKEEVEDFGDHGEEVTINSDGVHFKKKTIPYGAIDQDTPLVWETIVDESGVEKEYMTAKGYLWTGRYPFLKSVLESSKGQSMEFFEDSVSGDWAKFDNEEGEFFIFNEASISALCILGDDVEPCFEDAVVQRPRINYSLDKDEFKQEFNNFMLELDEVLHGEEGGVRVDKKDIKFAEESLAAAKEAVAKAVESKKKEDIDAAKTLVNKLEAGEDKDALVEKLDKIEVEDKKKDPADDFVEGGLEDGEAKIEEPIIEEPVVVKAVETNEEFEALKIEHEAVKTELEELRADFALLAEEREARLLEEKKEICKEFSVLGGDVIKTFEENLDQYTPEELEKELSVEAFRKGITFNLLNEETNVITPTPSRKQNTAPAWIKAIEKKQKSE